MTTASNDLFTCIQYFLTYASQALRNWQDRPKMVASETGSVAAAADESGRTSFYKSCCNLIVAAPKNASGAAAAAAVAAPELDWVP